MSESFLMLIFLLLSVFFYAVNNFYWKSHLQSFNPISLIWGRAVFTSIIALLGVACLTAPWEAFQTAYTEDGSRYLMTALLGFVGLISMVIGLKSSTLFQFSLFQGLITIVTGVGVGLLISISSEAIFGVMLVLIAYVIHIISDSAKDTTLRWKVTLWFLLMVSCFSASTFLNWELMQVHPPIFSIFFQELVILVGLTMLGLIVKGKVEFSVVRTKTVDLFLFALIIFGAMYFGAEGLKITNPFLVSAFGMIVPVLTALLGVVFLKEKMRVSYVGSVGLIILGVYLIMK